MLEIVRSIPTLTVLAMALQISACTKEPTRDHHLSVEDFLSYCSTFTSLDDRTDLSFWVNDHTFTVEPSPNTTHSDKKSRAKHGASGTWSSDEVRKLVTLNFGDHTSTYTLVARDYETECILVSGPVNAADLSRSWFGELDPNSDAEPPD